MTDKTKKLNEQASKLLSDYDAFSDRAMVKIASVLGFPKAVYFTGLISLLLMVFSIFSPQGVILLAIGTFAPMFLHAYFLKNRTKET